MADPLDSGQPSSDTEPVDAGERADVVDRFRAAWPHTEDAGTAPELLPTRLAVACKRVLELDGVGLSVISDRHRVPIGASDRDAVVAERLQFTVGIGPCLDALRGHRSVRADAEMIKREWPPFYDDLVRHTPYRSIAAVPLEIAPNIGGALDMYAFDPSAAHHVSAGEAATVAQLASTVLGIAGSSAPAPRERGDYGTPAWMLGPTARNRLDVWVSTGVLMVGTGRSSADALALLRAHAYAHDHSLDDVARAVVNGTIDARELELG